MRCRVISVQFWLFFVSGAIIFLSQLQVPLKLHWLTALIKQAGGMALERPCTELCASIYGKEDFPLFRPQYNLCVYIGVIERDSRDRRLYNFLECASVNADTRSAIIIIIIMAHPQ